MWSVLVFLAAHTLTVLAALLLFGGVGMLLVGLVRRRGVLALAGVASAMLAILILTSLFGDAALSG
ncbi:MAG: hypothetical protein HY369_01300 [Candidatus Aenigmarchaeota archaeon]|nr:hypothetical protein [Candidatus Aenigmarchaeota archaeon]